MSANQAFAGLSAGGSTPGQNPAYSGTAPSAPPATAPSAPPASAPVKARPVQSRQPAQAPVQYQSQESPKPQLERVLCGSCGATNGVPPGAPSFNCYKCGRTSTKPGLKQDPPPTQYVQQQRPPQQATTQQPVQVVQQQQQPTTVVVQQPATTVVAAPVVGNQLAYGAYGGGSGAAFATGMMMGAMLDPYPYGGFGYGYGCGFGGPMFW